MRSVNYICSCLVYGTLCLQGKWLHWGHFWPVSRLRRAVHNGLKDPNLHGLQLKSNLNLNIEFEVHFCSWLQILLIRFFCGLEIQIKITWENTYSEMLSKSMNPVSVKILNNFSWHCLCSCYSIQTQLTIIGQTKEMIKLETYRNRNWANWTTDMYKF